LPVKTAKIVAGYWQVFEDTAAWGEDSGYPGKSGNQVIFAHARKGLFLPLRGIAVGDKVYIMTDAAWYAYEVKEIKDVTPDQKEVIAPTTDETLTLYTCTGFEDSKRLIVVAKRV
jgi:sortase A